MKPISCGLSAYLLPAFGCAPFNAQPNKFQYMELSISVVMGSSLHRGAAPSIANADVAPMLLTLPNG